MYQYDFCKNNSSVIPIKGIKYVGAPGTKIVTAERIVGIAIMFIENSENVKKVDKHVTSSF